MGVPARRGQNDAADAQAHWQPEFDRHPDLPRGRLPVGRREARGTFAERALHQNGIDPLTQLEAHGGYITARRVR